MRNKAKKGGACVGGTISNSYFEANEATEKGGACIGVSSVTNSFFKNNKAKVGGAIAGSGHPGIESCTFISNTADNGGAIHNEPDNNFSYFHIVNNCTFIGNKASQNGGAIYGLVRYLFNTSIVNNEAGKEGGGFFSVNYDFIVGNTLIANNQAGEKGMDVICKTIRSNGGNLVSISGGSDGWKVGEDKIGIISAPIDALLGDTVRCGNNIYFRLRAGSPALGGGKDITDTAQYKAKCRDICDRERPLSCADIGSFQQSTCNSSNTVGGCQYTSRNLLSTFMAPLEVFPNPTSGVITLRLSEPKNGTAELYDLTGRMILRNVLTSESTELSLDGVASGVYTLKVKLDNSFRMIKIVVE